MAAGTKNVTALMTFFREAESRPRFITTSPILQFQIMDIVNRY